MILGNLLNLHRPHFFFFTLKELAHSFPRDAITEYHRLDGFKRQKYMASELWRLEILGQDVSRAMLSLKAPGEAPSSLRPTSGSCWKFLVLLGSWQRCSDLSLCLHRSTFPLCVCVKFLFSYNDASAWIRAHPDLL